LLSLPVITVVGVELSNGVSEVSSLGISVIPSSSALNSIVDVDAALLEFTVQSTLNASLMDSRFNGFQ